VEREGAAFSQESIDRAFQDFEPMKIERYGPRMDTDKHG